KSGRERGRDKGQRRAGLSLVMNVTRHILANHQTTLASYTRLVQQVLAGEAVAAGRELRHERQPIEAAAGNRPLVLLQRGAGAAQASKEILTVHERVAREVLSKVKVETLSERGGAAGTEPVLVVRRSQPGQPVAALTTYARTLLLSQLTRAQKAFGTKPLITARPGSITRAYVSPQLSARVPPEAIPQTFVLSNKAEQTEKTQAPARLERTFFRTVRREGRSRLTPSEKQAARPLSNGNLSEFISRAHSADTSPDEKPSLVPVGAKALGGLLTLRAGALQPLAALTRKVSVGRKLLSERHEEMERVLVSLRRETRLELPPLVRVFTSAQQRPVAEASHVVKQVEEKEVIENIRREVTTQMKSYSAAANFTRADFTIITDHVYDALARRLLSERERLGLNS
ncbi:MAG TPA: hypothetical protein VJS44_06185, partial [Pyrinomonadaceae bacterium]|nr:hypothetical protein [Pyrinomonadaceae bacterium]